MRKTKTGYAQKKRCQSRNRVVSPGRTHTLYAKMASCSDVHNHVTTAFKKQRRSDSDPQSSYPHHPNGRREF